MPDFVTTMAAHAAEIAVARDALGQWLRAHGVDRDVAADLLVVASELLANGVTATGNGGTVTLGGAVDREGVTIEVANEVTRWVPPADRWDLDNPLRAGGRGLLIVSALVDSLEVEHDVRNGRTVVRARRLLDPGAHREGAEVSEVADLEPDVRF